MARLYNPLKDTLCYNLCDGLHPALGPGSRAQIFPTKLSAAESLASYEPLYCKSLLSIFFSP